MFLFVILMSMLLVGLVYFIFFCIFYKNDMYMEILSGYECGFDMGFITRFMFSYRFFLISILFIIFDVEISLMLPVPFLFLSELGISIFYMFVFILLMGLIYEYFYGSLDWLDFYEVKM